MDKVRILRLWLMWNWYKILSNITKILDFSLGCRKSQRNPTNFRLQDYARVTVSCVWWWMNQWVKPFQWVKNKSLKRSLGWRMFFFWVSALIFSSQSSLLWGKNINAFWITKSITHLQTVLIIFFKCDPWQLHRRTLTDDLKLQESLLALYSLK